MKKLLLVSALLFLFFLAFVSCSDAPPEKGGSLIPKTDAVLAGKIVQIYDNSILLAGMESAELYMISSAIDTYNADGELADASVLKTGLEVEVGYSGVVMESYPAQLGKPVYIKITGQDDDLVGFYQSIVKDLWKVDEGLNSDIRILAFDLTQVVNLSAAEKRALVYVASEAYGLEAVTGTFDELSEQGYIDKEKLSFENGMLVKFELTDVTENNFTFNVSKWRSGDGAYFFRDCKAIKIGNDWSYSIGTEMIS